MTTTPAARILVAEDDAELRCLVADALRADGHEVTEVTDGGRMLVALARAHAADGVDYDLLVSDLWMPVCTGLQLLENLRRAHCHVPMILMTAFADDHTRNMADAFSALVVDKPFRLDVLRGAVRDMLLARAASYAVDHAPSASGRRTESAP